MTNLHKVTVYAIGINGRDLDVITHELDNLNDDVLTHIGDITTVDIGEFHDEHPLNQGGCDYEAWFPPEPEAPKAIYHAVTDAMDFDGFPAMVHCDTCGGVCRISYKKRAEAFEAEFMALREEMRAGD